MKTTYDLSQLEWKLSGWIPYHWRLDRSMEIGASPRAEWPSMPAAVPGSVQKALKEAGVIPDWNYGLNYQKCEWVENRHWIFEAEIPDAWVDSPYQVRLNCRGLDGAGWLLVNSAEVGDFANSYIPHVFDISPYLVESQNVIRIVFACPPRWLGQFGYTSKMTDWKVRFNYTWDWTVRLVQLGIWDNITLEVTHGGHFETLRAVTQTDAAQELGTVRVVGEVPSAEGLTVSAELTAGDRVVYSQDVSAAEFNDVGLTWSSLDVDLWWPNGHGEQPLYTLTCSLLDADGNELDCIVRRLGFLQVEWEQCEGAPPGADPWICVANGKPIFLQGANWTPLLPNFADATVEDYRKHLELYRDLGFNIMRVWGGAFLEKECFYHLCDELGLLVWQEFPLSSSGRENLPPSDERSIEGHAEIARSYIFRRQHHVSLIIWCGGNELQNEQGVPCDLNYPLLKRHHEVVSKYDPLRRYLPTSSSGPRFYADPSLYGTGVHWDVHGPWKADGDLANWRRDWEGDDALMRSETGAPGTSSAEIIRKYAGDYDPEPANWENPLWRRTSVWWIEWDQFVVEKGREPKDLEDYVQWSQQRQKEAVSIAVEVCKNRFPACGGIIIWMGHDCFPCTANTAIIDFHCNPKPAGEAVGEIFRRGLPHSGPAREKGSTT